MSEDSFWEGVWSGQRYNMYERDDATPVSSHLRGVDWVQLQWRGSTIESRCWPSLFY